MDQRRPPEGGRVNGSQSKFLEGTWPISQIRQGPIGAHPKRGDSEGCMGDIREIIL
jgi:hypothetical protein